LGLTYIEALISGLPAITTNAPPMCEFIEHEKTGLLVDADIVPGKKISSNLRIQAALVKIDALAESIIYLSNNPSCIEYMSSETEKFRNKYAEYVVSFETMLKRVREQV